MPPIPELWDYIYMPPLHGCITENKTWGFLNARKTLSQMSCISTSNFGILGCLSKIISSMISIFHVPTRTYRNPSMMVHFEAFHVIQCSKRSFYMENHVWVIILTPKVILNFLLKAGNIQSVFLRKVGSPSTHCKWAHGVIKGKEAI